MASGSFSWSVVYPITIDSLAWFRIRQVPPDLGQTQSERNFVLGSPVDPDFLTFACALYVGKHAAAQEVVLAPDGYPLASVWAALVSLAPAATRSLGLV